MVGNEHSLRAAGGDGWCRRDGERGWNRLDEAMPPGIINFAWRDHETGHVRATASAILRPSDFQVARQVSGDTINLTVTGWPALVTSSVGLLITPNRWQVSVVPRERTLPILALSQNAEPPLQIVIELPQRA